MNKYIKIEFEGNCNLSCDYCFVDYRVKIDTDKMIKHMEEIFKKNGPKCIYKVECIGEITLYPEILSYLGSKVEEDGYEIHILSNGVKTVDVKIASLFKWSISLDGHTVKMNKYRKLDLQRIENILNNIFSTNADIQCVFNEQSVFEMNSFILYLKDKGFKGALHIFPCRFANTPLNRYLDYDKLVKASFIPSEEYFRRWKYIFDNNKRNFTCDFYKNGYVYRIMKDGINVKEIKCDCAGSKFTFITGDENSKSFSEANCGTCINHFEYNESLQKERQFAMS
ncbi:radical SAM protein [Acetivibrio cellulolyticus]|uniref:radical SAM protein n=1 Tax=Acetivibrio cellulolyticus TaxID=35830 RepID=UPI0001E3017E|nr:radical SAM protein [Acetivibrio cellulolyticus]